MAASETRISPWPDAVTHLLEECRMILPGLQALLGFQLIAVFSAAFEQPCHPRSSAFTCSPLLFLRSRERWS